MCVVCLQKEGSKLEPKTPKVIIRLAKAKVALGDGGGNEYGGITKQAKKGKNSS